MGIDSTPGNYNPNTNRITPGGLDRYLGRQGTVGYGSGRETWDDD